MATQALITGTRYEDPKIIDTIRQTVAKGATDAQLRMFLEVCKRTGLDPFLKEIWYVAEKGIIMAGRDGYLRVANENPQFDGMETRVERDAQKVPIKATCTVWRKDRNHPIVCEAYFSEYNKQSPVWKQYPSAMISKVSEVLALKRSFAINGVVSEEEMGESHGSTAAQQQVLTEKLTRMKAGETYAQVSSPEPVNQETDVAAPNLEGLLATMKDLPSCRAAMAAMKAEFLTRLPEAEYRKILALHSMQADHDYRTAGAAKRVVTDLWGAWWGARPCDPEPPEGDANVSAA